MQNNPSQQLLLDFFEIMILSATVPLHISTYILLNQSLYELGAMNQTSQQLGKPQNHAL